MSEIYVVVMECEDVSDIVEHDDGFILMTKQEVEEFVEKSSYQYPSWTFKIGKITWIDE